MTADYNCKNCKQPWELEFTDEDQDVDDSFLANMVCPLCMMPFWQMVRDTYREGGIREVIFWIIKRYF